MILRRLLLRLLCAVHGHDLCVALNYKLAWRCRCGAREETYKARIFVEAVDRFNGRS